MYVIVRNGLFYSRKKDYKMMDIREHPKVVYLYERLLRMQNGMIQNWKLIKFVKK